MYIDKGVSIKWKVGHGELYIVQDIRDEIKRLAEAAKIEKGLAGLTTRPDIQSMVQEVL